MLQLTLCTCKLFLRCCFIGYTYYACDNIFCWLFKNKIYIYLLLRILFYSHGIHY